MDLSSVSPQDVATIALFIAPGYFALQGYVIVHTKVDKNFSKLLIECIALSLPLVGIYNAVWPHYFNRSAMVSTHINYFVPLLVSSLILGYLAAILRSVKWIQSITNFLKIPGPNDDFIAVQFKKLKPDEIVTVTLKGGDVFSGIRHGMSVYRKDEEQKCYFSYVEWFNKETDKWDKREGSIIIGLDEIAYIETATKIPD